MLIQSAAHGRLLILAGAPLATLLPSALDAFPLNGSIAVAAARQSLAVETDSPARLVASQLHLRGFHATIVAPPASLPVAWLRRGRTEWRAVDVSDRAARLDRVWLPASLAEAEQLVLVNRLTLDPASTDPVAIGAWSRFAHPRQRTGAAVSRQDGGLAVELALAVRPALILLVADLTTGPLLLASNDQIAAELAGLAVRASTRVDASEHGGPWEDPLVQRATELELGVRLPAEIAAELGWLGPRGPVADAFTERAVEWLRRIGVRPISGP